MSFAFEDRMAYVFGQPFLVGQLPVIPQVPIVPQQLGSQQVVYQKHPEPLSEEKLQEKGLLIVHDNVVMFKLSQCTIKFYVYENVYSAEDKCDHKKQLPEMHRLLHQLYKLEYAC